MPRDISTDMGSHLVSEHQYRVLMLRLDCVFGDSLGMTEHDQDIVYDLGDTVGPVTYRSVIAIFPSQLQLSRGFDTDDVEIRGQLNPYITREKLWSGYFADAVVYLFMVNWQDLGFGHIALFKGLVTDIKLNDDEWVFSLSSESAKYRLIRGRVVTPYDDNPTPPDDTPVTATVVSVTNTRVINVSFSGTYDDGYFNRGTMAFTSGPLIGGRRIEIASWLGTGDIESWTRFPVPPQVGDTLELRREYPRTIAAFVTRFGDAVDFRGFPYVPGKDRYIAFPVPSA